jgi:hypothetical protein
MLQVENEMERMEMKPKTLKTRWQIFHPSPIAKVWSIITFLPHICENFRHIIWSNTLPEGLILDWEYKTSKLRVHEIHWEINGVHEIRSEINEIYEIHEIHEILWEINEIHEIL